MKLTDRASVERAWRQPARYLALTLASSLSACSLYAESPRMLGGAWVPEDSHQIDFASLPRVPSEHIVLSDVHVPGTPAERLDKKKGGVNQHNYLAHFGGKFWAMWSDGPGIEDRVGQRVKFATSADGLRWSKPKFLTPAQACCRQSWRTNWISRSPRGARSSSRPRRWRSKKCCPSCAAKRARWRRSPRACAKDPALTFDLRLREVYALWPAHPLIHLALAAYERPPDDKDLTEEQKRAAIQAVAKRAAFLRDYSLKRLPDDVALLTRAARMLSALNDHTRTVATTERALRLDPQNAECLRLRDESAEKLRRP